MAAMGVFLIFLGGKRQFAGSKVFTGLQSSVVTIYPFFCMLKKSNCYNRFCRKGDGMLESVSTII